VPKGYWIVQVDVTDPERYKEYLRLDAEVFKEFRATPLVRGGRALAPEGPARSRQVVLEFESFDKAVECYNSPGYQEAVKHRLAASESSIVIVEGV
jgi:uncharacterized protein (DUF1330 family)